MKTMLLRLALFYFLALSVILAVVPWTLSGATIVTESPFVKVFSNFGLGYAATVMNFVILSAALSSMNTNLYLCTRMIFSLSRSGHAPAALGKVNARGTPLRAAVLSSWDAENGPSLIAALRRCRASLPIIALADDRTRAVPAAMNSTWMPGQSPGNWITPSCRISPRSSRSDQCSAIFPFSTRWMATPVSRRSAPVGGRGPGSSPSCRP